MLDGIVRILINIPKTLYKKSTLIYWIYFIVKMMIKQNSGNSFPVKNW